MALLVAACTSGDGARSAAPTSSPSLTAGADAIVGGTGVSAVLHGVSVTAGADVAAPGTHLRLSRAAVPALPADTARTVAAVDLELGDGLQPKTPVTVTAVLPTGLSEDLRPVLLTRRGSGPWQALPMTSSGGRATATLDHLSTAWVVLVGSRLIDPVVKFLSTVLGQRYPKPDCVGRTAVLGGKTYRAAATGDGLYACVSEQRGELKLQVSSNSPFVWRVKPLAGVGQRPIAPLTVAGVLTTAVFDASIGYQFERQTAVVPGGSAAVIVNPDDAPMRASADVEPLLGYVAIAVAGIEEGLAVFNLTLSALEQAAAGECMASAISLGVSKNSLPERAAELLTTTLSCLGTVASGAAAVVITLIGTLSSLLITQLRGIAGEVTRSNHQFVGILLAGGGGVSDVVLGPRGSIAVAGTNIASVPRDQAIAALTSALGKPTVHVSHPGQADSYSMCDTHLIYGTVAEWGSLRVLIPSKEQPPGLVTSVEHPDRVSGWSLGMYDNTPQPALRTARGVGVGSSLAAVRKAYPGGGLSPYDGSQLYTAPGTDLRFGFAETSPDGVLFMDSGLSCGS